MKLALKTLLFSAMSINAMESDQGKKIYDDCTLYKDWHDQAVEIFEDTTIKEIASSLETANLEANRKKIYQKLCTSNAFPKIKKLFQAIQKKEPNIIDSDDNEHIAANYIEFLQYFQQEEKNALKKDIEAKKMVEEKKVRDYLKPMHLLHWELKK